MSSRRVIPLKYWATVRKFLEMEDDAWETSLREFVVRDALLHDELAAEEADVDGGRMWMVGVFCVGGCDWAVSLDFTEVL